MTLKQLRYLIAIAEAGSFSSAARRAYIAQPALSRQINLLESELEMQLLERVHDGVNLTDAGRRLYEIARSVVQTIDTVKDELESTKGNPKGRVAIAIPVTASALLLPLIITRANEKFPGIELTVRDGLSQEGGEAIELGKVDFGLVPNAEELEHVHVEPIFTEELYWLSVQASACSDESITLAKALSQPLVMAPRASSHLRRRENRLRLKPGWSSKCSTSSRPPRASAAWYAVAWRQPSVTGQRWKTTRNSWPDALSSRVCGVPCRSPTRPTSH